MKILTIELKHAKVCLDVSAIEAVILDKSTGQIDLELDNRSSRTIMPNDPDHGASIYQDILLAMKELEDIHYSPQITWAPQTTGGIVLCSDGTAGKPTYDTTITCHNDQPPPIDWERLHKEYQPGRPDVNFSAER